eukprot:2841858-Rhodomonas_salina.1
MQRQGHLLTAQQPAQEGAAPPLELLPRLAAAERRQSQTSTHGGFVGRWWGSYPAVDANLLSLFVQLDRLAAARKSLRTAHCRAHSSGQSSLRTARRTQHASARV